MDNAYPAATAALLLSMNVNAGPSDHDGHHHHNQQQAHLHGLAEVTLALEGNIMEVVLDSPAANIVGFEHVAATPEQRRVVADARAILESPSRLFVFNGTRCELKQLDVDVSAVLGDEDNKLTASERKESKHHHHDKSGHSHSDHQTHSEVAARYQFDCKQGSELTAVSLGFIKHFPGIETLKAMWVTDSHQGSAELTATSDTIYLAAKP